jgi:hypothetical protein
MSVGLSLKAKPAQTQSECKPFFHGRNFPRGHGQIGLFNPPTAVPRHNLVCVIAVCFERFSKPVFFPGNCVKDKAFLAGKKRTWRRRLTGSGVDNEQLTPLLTVRRYELGDEGPELSGERRPETEFGQDELDLQDGDRRGIFIPVHPVLVHQRKSATPFYCAGSAHLNPILLAKYCGELPNDRLRDSARRKSSNSRRGQLVCCRYQGRVDPFVGRSGNSHQRPHD